MSYTSKLAARLMQVRLAKSALPTAIFGSADTLSQALEIDRPPVRIGVWPIICQQIPQVDMGIATVLAFMLERYEKTRVYRLFAQLDGEPDSYSWSIEASQFDVDDWQLDDLDENAAVWGNLEQTAEEWQLKLNVENDMAAEGESIQIFTAAGAQLADLVAALPYTAKEIAAYLGAGEAPLVSPLFTLESRLNNAENLERLLCQAFTCELKLFLALWGVAWASHQIIEETLELIDIGVSLNSLGEWVAASTISRLIGQAPALDESTITEITDMAVNQLSISAIGHVIIAGGLYRSGYTQMCFSVLEAAIERYADSTLPRIALGEYLRLSARLFEALDVFQEAIEENVVDADLYLRYASLLTVLDYSGMVIEDFVLIDITQRASNLIALEALAAYTAALELAPSSAQALSGQLAQLLDIGAVNERFWTGFGRLVEMDVSGELVRNLLDSMNGLDDVHPAVQTLESAFHKYPDRADIAVNLAAAHILQGQGQSALQVLDRARSLTADLITLADIERLTIGAKDPDFERRIGDILELISKFGQYTKE